MFTHRLSEAFCCCQVRTGALLISIVYVTFAIIYTIETSFELAVFDQSFLRMLKEWRAIKVEGDEDGVWKWLADNLEEHKEDIRHFIQLALVYSIGQCLIDTLLIFGLAKKRHVPCMPWLIYNGLGLTVTSILVVVCVIWLWVNGGAGTGFLALFLGLTFVGFWFYIFKVVQTEWMNIKDLDAPARQLEHGGKF